MTSTIYFRASRETMEEEELAAAKKYFNCVPNRTMIKAGDFVIPRYSMLPFPKELEEDVRNIGASLINSYYQHAYVADLQNWVADLSDLTPLTWTRLELLPDDCSFILKGATNSKKFSWNKLMFAGNKQQAMDIYFKLAEDGLIGCQDIYIRKYIPLFTYFISLQGLPITKEFRFFVCYGKIICGDFYWSAHVEEIGFKPDVAEVPKEFLEQVIARVGKKINFFTLDVAQTAEGEWIVMELNDGTMSGLSCNDPEKLYSGLKKIF